MCEYCDEDFGKRDQIMTSDGHDIRIDNDNDISILFDFDDYNNYLYFEINYCPWCGRKLKD